MAHPTVDEFAEECRAFLDAHARPRPRPAAGPFVWGAGDDRVVLFDEEDREEIEAARAWRALRHKAGLDWISGPEEYGGRGLPPAYERIYADREAAYDVPDQSFFKIGLGIIAPTLLAHAGETVKRRYLPSMFSGERLACQLFSEPAAGSDLASLTTRAVRDGDGWVVSGQKVWTSGAHLCDLGELLARTDPAAPKHKGISAFLVDLHAPGVEVRPLRQMTGGGSFNEVFLDEVRVPDDHRLAGVNEGWTVAMTTLLHERELIGSGGGDGRQFGSAASFERVAATAAHFGRSADRRLRQRLAGFYIAGRLAELNSARAAARARAGQPPGPEMAGAKLALAAHLNDAAALLGEILGPHLAADSGRWGGYGWLEFVLGTPGIRIAGGTDEVLRNVIAERVLGLPR
ncbi:MAG TPA: acyl-CoA dehydrogenase family protein [Acidimicrobiia bacterium]|nr:acyl-CoA dehydrogenase family protein [Acidimicrobiia bacterium]